MLLTDFENAIRAILLLRLNLEPGDAARLMSDHSNKIEYWFDEGYQPIEVVSIMVGRDLPENFDVNTGHAILTQLVIDPETGEPRVARVA